MRIVFAVLLLFVVYVASYPSLREVETDDDDSNNDLELELRSILNHLNDEQDDDEQMTRALSSEENEDEGYEMSKRQGGLNMVDQQSKCEITCIHSERNPASGKGKTIKDAAKACKNRCNASSKKRGGGKKKAVVQRTSPQQKKMNVRDIVDDDDNSNSSDEEQQQQNERREFYDYLMEQVQRNNEE